MPEQHFQGNKRTEKHGSFRPDRKVPLECLRQASGNRKTNDQGRNQEASRKVTNFPLDDALL